MEKSPSYINFIQKDNWSNLRKFSKARIALGNVGGSMPLKETLDFQAAHAFAKDAIYIELNKVELSKEMKLFKLPFFYFESRVENRDEYLKRPDLGRQLSENKPGEAKNETDIAIIIADGLSAEAVNSQAILLLKELLPEITGKYKVSLCLAKNARVALGDEIAEVLGAKFSAVLIGERPGLSSPKSMGIYSTYAPKVGLTDERRNCISNIHEDGLSIKKATELLLYLIEQSFQKKISGVKLRQDLKNIKEENA